MKISWPKTKKYTLAQQRRWKKLAQHCMNHYPKDQELHRAVKGCFSAFEEWGRKQAKSTTRRPARRTAAKRTTRRTAAKRTTRRTAAKRTPKRRTASRRTTRRGAPKRRTTARRRAA